MCVPVLLLLAAAMPGLGQAGGAVSAHAPEPLLTSIRKLVERGDFAGARAQTIPALRKYPREPVLHNFLGVLEAQQGKYREAESSFRRAMELAPAYAAAYQNLGRLYQENLGKDEQAVRKGIAVYRALLRLDPASVEANYQIAVLYGAAGAYQDALAHLDRLPPEARDRAQPVSVRLAALAALGDHSAAGRAGQQLLDSPDLSEPDVVPILPALAKAGEDALAIRLLERLSERRLAAPETLRSLGALYEKQGKLADARQAYERSAAPGTLGAPLLVDLARVAYQQKDFEGTLSYLAHARELEPKNAGIHFFFGLASVELNLPLEAEKSLREAMKLDPENPYYSYALGAVIAASRKWSEAIPYFEKYHAKKPGDPKGKLALASAHFHSYAYDEARAELRELVDKPETAAGAHYYLGLLSLQDNEFPEAIRQLQRAVQSNPDFAEAHAELGFAYMQMEQYDEARAALERSVKLNPDGRRANMVLLSLYQRTEDPRAAAQQKRFDELDKQMGERIKLLLRTIEVRPY